MRQAFGKHFGIAIAALALFAGRPVLDLVHYLTVPHTYCSAHAALEHRHDSDEPHENGALASVKPAGHSHDHQLCGWVALLRQPAALPATTAVADLSAFSSSPVTETGRGAFAATTPLYRLAPKNSPPALA